MATHTQVILMEGIHGVGTVGQVVRVKSGFARNFLLPRKLALLANKLNVAKVEAQKSELEAKNAASRKAAEAEAGKFKDLKLVITRHASETGQLYGSVKARDFADELASKGLKVEPSQIILTDAVKMVGEHTIRAALHAEVLLSIPVTVQRKTEI
ncbi:MAG: 50S ribosomal protein L9 [Alphaproteobacteria bacterium]